VTHPTVFYKNNLSTLTPAAQRAYLTLSRTIIHIIRVFLEASEQVFYILTIFMQPAFLCLKQVIPTSQQQSAVFL
jgi:hypothetical protein